ncbi:TPA: type I-E CRISPR-associated protein Cse2/CasB [Salmonella enterica]|nr:type I-E CRISPR-associated protein Cse2/CasB [Salmonella enterica]
MSKNTINPVNEQDFVQRLFNLFRANKQLAVQLSHADHPTKQERCRETLAGMGIALDDEAGYLPHVLITAAIARDKRKVNGVLALGEAITLCFSDGENSKQADVLLRQLLACDSVEQLFPPMRHLLLLIESRVNRTLNYQQLLDELLQFSADEDGVQRVKERWAMQFYGRNDIQ